MNNSLICVFKQACATHPGNVENEEARHQELAPPVSEFAASVSSIIK